jgi:hypothetical protein
MVARARNGKQAGLCPRRQRRSVYFGCARSAEETLRTGVAASARAKKWLTRHSWQHKMLGMSFRMNHDVVILPGELSVLLLGLSLRADLLRTHASAP